MIDGSNVVKAQISPLIQPVIARSLRNRLHTQLEVLLRPALTMEGAFRQLQPGVPLGKNDLAPTIIHAVIMPRLDYCNVLNVGLPLKAIWKLHMIQSIVDNLIITITGRNIFEQCLKIFIDFLPSEVR